MWLTISTTTRLCVEEDEDLWLYESDDSEDSYEFESISKGYYEPLNKSYSTSPVIPTESHHGSSLAITLSHTVGAPAEQSAEQDSRASPRESGRDCSTPTFVQGQRIQSTVAPDKTSPYLDWAIMSVDEATSSSRRHNLIHARQNTWIRLQATINFPPTGITPVVMVSGIKGVRSGEILHGMSYIGSRPGQQMCRAWTMLLTSPKGVFPGECGSIVVDQKSFEVYGHVVGSNHLGHAYIVPLSDTFDQIRTAFNSENVGFPSLTREFRPAPDSEHSTTHRARASSSISNDPSWESRTGSARNYTQDDRLAEVAYSRQERMLYASRLLGPNRPPTHRSSAADDVHAYERLYGGQQQQQYVTPPTVYYDDQFGTLPAASSYAQVLPELEDFDTSSNSRRSESSRAKEHGSQQKHESPRH
ncbi:hypothetical protein CDEST_12725 [Colletotrichum destructivum]|uniref:Uncharacterized protein n=1 Tax=Colletotrichum destructivum TaxID=34406 RepID=A0AAX4IXD8_9PEZI|nr:hypothetical protein CDEST_12725 [Colletotrichum destructivum]